MLLDPAFLKKIFSRQLIISSAILLFLLVFYSLLRTGFYITNREFYSGTTAQEIQLAFIYGLRFDIAALFIINIPVLFLYNFPLAPVSKKWYKLTVFAFFLLINIIFITLNIADFGYFAAEQRRLMYEPYTMPWDILRMIPSAISYHYLLFITLIIITVLFIYFFIKLYSKLESLITLNRIFLTELFSFVVLVLVSVVAVRGGFQLKPLRQANAFITDSRSLGYLTLNTTYNVVLSAFQDVLPDISVMQKSDAEHIVMDMLRDANERVIDSQYIFMRQKISADEPRKLNVIIFIMESWSAKYSGVISGGKTSTPFFDSLSSHGILFTNFFATGQRSIEAIPSILTSVPSLFNASIINSTAEMDSYRGLGSILKEAGYTTSFHHGASVGSMGFNGFSRIAGFIHYYGKEDFSFLPSADFDGAWGIYDEPFFIETGKIISRYNQPFCSVIFSLSSHDPYKIPENRLALFEPYKEESEYERSIRYSDYSLQHFFAAASSEPWFNNTLFVITADHTLFNSRDNFYSCFHVPLLLYTPQGLLKPSKESNVASHIDILPSILDILRISAIHSSMGTSVFSSHNNRYCFEKYGNDYCIINNEFVLLNDLENSPKLYNYKNDPSLKNDLASSLHDKASELNRKLLAYIQTTTEAISNNKIYRDSK